MNKTKIEWVKNPDGSQGYTWNPITGCNNQIDGMCRGGNFPCYAYRLANGRLRDRYLANKNTATTNYDEDSYPFYPRFWEDRLYQLDSPRLWETKHKPKGIFVCDMSDLFGIGIPEEWTMRILDYIRRCPNDRFYLLTKQPQNLIKWSPFPDNCWVGVTATTQKALDAAMPYLLQIDCLVRYVSIEPCLERIDISPYLPDTTYNFGSWYQDNKGIGRWDLGGAPCNPLNWVIIGAQTKPYKPPKREWVQEIALATTKARIPLFLKDSLHPLLPQRMPFWSPVYWVVVDKGAKIKMGENRLRQEFPTKIASGENDGSSHS